MNYIGNGWSYQDVVHGTTNMMSSAFSAGASIVLPFHWLMLKSFYQKGEEGNRPQFRSSLSQGVRAASAIAAIICAQTTAQTVFEQLVVKASGNPQASAGFWPMFASALFVGWASARPLTRFNALTMRLPYVKPRFEQMCAIMGRETAFLFSLRMSSPVSEWAKKRFGNNPIVDYGSTAATGAVGSLCGHPCDTWLTRSQAGLPIQNVRQLMTGGASKALAIASFSVSYRVVNELLSKLRGKKELAT